MILKNYRNFKNFEAEFSPEKTLIIGPNGVGKSNILEAVYFLASGVARRAEEESELIRLGFDFAKIAVISDGEELDLTVNYGPDGRLSKTGKINGVKKSWSRILGTFKASLFSPEDINLVTGAPEIRRRYLNSILNQADFEYRRSFIWYEKARREKNRLLSQIRDGLGRRFDLALWNEPLLKFGQEVSVARQKYLEALSRNEAGFGFIYKPSLLNETRLNEFEEREIAAGVSLIGPHRDDFGFAVPQGHPFREGERGGLKDLNLALFGSRGQQRLAVFELKLGEIDYLKKSGGGESGQSGPLLLLDDIFSELDEEHRREVLSRLNVTDGRQTSLPARQVIFTATDAETLDPEFLKSAKVIKLN